MLYRNIQQRIAAHNGEVSSVASSTSLELLLAGLTDSRAAISHAPSIRLTQPSQTASLHTRLCSC